MTASANTPSRLLVRMGPDRWRAVDLADVYFVEAEGDHTRVRCALRIVDCLRSSSSERISARRPRGLGTFSCMSSASLHLQLGRPAVAPYVWSTPVLNSGMCGFMAAAARERVRTSLVLAGSMRPSIQRRAAA